VSLNTANNVTFTVDANAASSAKNRFSLVLKNPTSLNAITKASFTVSHNPTE
jgi:hypothetical protein